MPINESTRKKREQWPLEFDLTGVPRDNLTRKTLLQQRQIEESSDLGNQEDQNMAITNSFAVDKPEAPIVDINNPPRVNYNPNDPKNEFPKMLYHHETGRVLKVEDAKQEKAALKRGFELKPSKDHDYSKISRAGIAAAADSGPKREEEMSAEELAALDEEDEA